MELGRFKGNVIRYDVIKSFGFIRITHDVNKKENIKPTDYGDVFIYVSDIEPDKDCLKKLIKGQTVEFDVTKSNKGLKALNLKIMGDTYDNEGEINYNC